MESLVTKKLKDFFEDGQCQKQWLARKIGMSASMLYFITVGKIITPEKYWLKFVENSRGFLTIDDFIHDYFAHKAKLLNTPLTIEPHKSGSWVIRKGSEKSS